jgi:hypothetical protein
VKWRVVEADTSALVAECESAEEAHALARASVVLVIVERADADQDDPPFLEGGAS